MKAARIAVGGLVLAEVTGGFAAVPAYAAEPVPHVSPDCHHPHHRHAPVRHARKQVTPKPKPVRVVTKVVTREMPAPELFDHYVVRPGDTLTHIAAAYGIPWEVLWSLNTDIITHPDYIYVGQSLRLPG